MVDDLLRGCSVREILSFLRWIGVPGGMLEVLDVAVADGVCVSCLKAVFLRHISATIALRCDCAQKVTKLFQMCGACGVVENVF